MPSTNIIHRKSMRISNLLLTLEIASLLRDYYVVFAVQAIIIFTKSLTRAFMITSYNALKYAQISPLLM
jgi:hypothetical protein